MLSLKSLFSIGFRPFFLLASLIAILNPTLWVSIFTGQTDLAPMGSPLFWHSHEMVFGFTSSLIAGFLLTASANWTNTKAYSGAPLYLLVLFWLLERVSFFISLSDFYFLILSNIFLPLLIILLFLKLNKFPAQKFVFIPFLGALFSAKLMHAYGFLYSIDVAEEIGLDSGIGLIRFLLFLLAGRVLPFFTRVKLGIKEFNIPKSANFLALFPVLILATPISKFESIYILFLFLAIIGNLYRNFLFFKKPILKVPMLWVLHLGLNFLIAGLLLELLSIYYPGLNQNQEALHATMTGGLGVIAIGIMSRVSLGHTGRTIKANPSLILSFLLVFLGALIRAFIPILMPEYYEKSLHFASGFWTLGFLIFFLNFVKVLCSPRPDGK